MLSPAATRRFATSKKESCGSSRCASRSMRLYRYGTLHGFVRLSLCGDHRFPVAWALPCDPNIHDVLRRGRETGSPLEIVTDLAPSFRRPWSDARRIEVLEVEPYDVLVREDGGEVVVRREDIQAVRVAPRSARAS